MKVKIDEQLSKLLKAPLQKLGHEVSTVFEQGLSGTLDHDLWPIIQTEEKFLITADKEFGDIRKFPPGSHFGCLLLRPNAESIGSYLELLENLLSKHDLEDLKRKTSVMSSRGLRIRTS